MYAFGFLNLNFDVFTNVFLAGMGFGEQWGPMMD
jgi:hypothetical protein